MQAPAIRAPLPAEAASTATPAPLPLGPLPAYLPAFEAPEFLPWAGPAPAAETAPGFGGHAAPFSWFRKKLADRVAAMGKTAEFTHDGLERGILQQAIRLDNFFGTANSQPEQHTSYLLRWRSGLRLEQGGHFNVSSALNANFDLSRINDRLRLSISGENNRDPFAPSLPEDPGTPGFDRTLQTSTRIVNTELRYQLVHSHDTDLFLGSGIDFVWPPQIFGRARYQQIHRFSDTTLLNFSETFFLKTHDGAGETTVFSVQHSLDPKTVVHWSTSGTVSQEIGALEWGSELSLIHELSPRSAITALGGIYGNTSFHDWISNYRVLLRYRHNFLRSWLFYELEPEVTWPRQGDGSFPIAYGVTVRLEVVFRGEEKKKAVSLP